jgi:hypothetical protein
LEDRSGEMRILELFDKYFLILMIIQGFMVSVVDAATFKKKGMKVAAKKAKYLGAITIGLSVVLFIVRNFI